MRLALGWLLFLLLIFGVNAPVLEDLGSIALPDPAEVIAALRTTWSAPVAPNPLDQSMYPDQPANPAAAQPSDSERAAQRVPRNQATHRLLQAPPATPVLSRPTNILLLGTDVVYTRAQRRTIANKLSLRGNSDSIMLIHSDPARNTVAILQIPRDTQVSIHGHGSQKINAANPIGGPALVEEAVSELVGVPIDRYVVMNIGGLVDLVNELGGVTVQVPKRMHYIDWTAKLNIDLQPGLHTLTGNQAMGFVRFRNDGAGDIGRVKRQQIFLNAFVLKALTPSNWSHLPALLTIAQRNINTDIRSDEFLQCINFLRSLQRENIRIAMLPGRSSGDGNWIVDRDTARAFVDKLNNSVAGNTAAQSAEF